MPTSRYVDCLCWHQHLDDCPNYVSLEERRAFYASAIEARERRNRVTGSGPKGESAVGATSAETPKV